MTNKEMMRNKVTHLEKALMQTSFTMNKMEEHIDTLQKQINDYKKSGDKDSLVQNNDLIIDLIEERLRVGAERYHQNVPILPQDDLTRDNFYEAVEEALDLSVYLAAFMLRIMEQKENMEEETNQKVKDEKAKESTA